MAQRRMISKNIAEDDRFVDMQLTSKLLYFYLVLNADDDGFVGSVKMINFLTSADRSNYDELLKNNLILEPTQNGVYVITDWYSQNKIEDKIYKPTEHLSIRATLYLKTNFAYTTDPNSNDIISPVDYWIKQGRDKKTPPEAQAQQYLQHIQETSKKLPRSVNETSSKVLAQNRIDQSREDQSRSEKTREDQISQEKTNKEKSINTHTTSSNGGMGEISSSFDISTSSKDHNATSKSGLDTGLPSGADTGVNNDTTNNSQDKDVNIMIGYIAQAFNCEIPDNNQRIAFLLESLLNRYKVEYIKDAVDDLSESYSDINGQQLTSLLVNHLEEYIYQETQSY